MHIYVVANLLLLYFWIKLIMKMHKFLTIQKPNNRQFSVSGFAAALKPNNFDGKNFMIWRAKMVLWLTAVGYHKRGTLSKNPKDRLNLANIKAKEQSQGLGRFFDSPEARVATTLRLAEALSCRGPALQGLGRVTDSPIRPRPRE